LVLTFVLLFNEKMSTWNPLARACYAQSHPFQ
jgi:hypothetical protein